MYSADVCRENCGHVGRLSAKDFQQLTDLIICHIRLDVEGDDVMDHHCSFSLWRCSYQSRAVSKAWSIQFILDGA
ncbi:hypothetical protein G419_15092 [Rhodococcus triatomae BKS 15-14]|nr:hypothetical protein G419_15092 [Rhodococcus triatomae BKS 15-14]